MQPWLGATVGDSFCPLSPPLLCDPLRQCSYFEGGRRRLCGWVHAALGHLDEQDPAHRRCVVKFAGDLRHNRAVAGVPDGYVKSCGLEHSHRCVASLPCTCAPSSDAVSRLGRLRAALAGPPSQCPTRGLAADNPSCLRGSASLMQPCAFPLPPCAPVVSHSTTL